MAIRMKLRTRFVLHGDSVADFAEVFDIEHHGIKAHNLDGKPTRIHLRDLEFHINKTRKDISSGNAKIIELWAGVDGPNLLNAWFRAEWKDGESVQSLTYCGNFTVWWDEDEPKTD